MVISTFARLHPARANSCIAFVVQLWIRNGQPSRSQFFSRLQWDNKNEIIFFTNKRCERKAKQNQRCQAAETKLGHLSFPSFVSNFILQRNRTWRLSFPFATFQRFIALHCHRCQPNDCSIQSQQRMLLYSVQIEIILPKKIISNRFRTRFMFVWCR